jgi:hypothetical protein
MAEGGECIMTKSSEQGENEYTRQARQEAARTGKDVCEILRAMRAEAIREGDKGRGTEDHSGREIPRLPESQETRKVMSIKYAAHLIMAIRFVEGKQERFPCYENVVLVYAKDEDEALEQARKYGEEEAKAGGQFCWNDREAVWKFLGVRKLIECRTPGNLDNRLGRGTEVTYSLLELPNEEALQKLAAGEPVEVTYRE